MSKLTKEQLQAMSDMQALRNLYELLGFEVHEYEFEGVITIQKWNKVTTAELLPNDIMPMAFEHSVSLIKMLSGWRACTNNGIYVVHSFDDENPLRAVVCCLILVLQEQK